MRRYPSVGDPVIQPDRGIRGEVAIEHGGQVTVVWSGVPDTDELTHAQFVMAFEWDGEDWVLSVPGVEAAVAA